MPEVGEIVSQFASLGIDLDDETAAACLDLCLRYSIDEESFCNSWVAFSISSLSGANPSKDNLSLLEKKELSSMKTPKRSSTSSRIQVYSTPKTVHSAESFTPPRSGPSGAANTKKLVFSPMVNTPDAYSPSEKFNGRKNSGQVVSTFGKSLYAWKSVKNDVEISTYTIFSDDASKWKFFYDTMTCTSSHVEDRAERLAADIVLANKLPEPVPFDNCGLELMTFRGKVCPYDKGKKSKQLNSVQIQGMAESDYRIVDVDVTEVTDFAIFPGQILVFEGILVGKAMRAKALYASGAATSPPPPTLSLPTQILVAAGPFALSDTLSYEPLNELVDLVKREQPNVLILVGPLVDATHPKIAKGQIAETFSDYYARMVKRIGDSLGDTYTKVVVIASSKDANNVPVYPTPPAIESPYKNVKFFPDPAILFIEGLVVGMTSVDTLFHLGKYELTNCQSNRLARLASHTIRQECFYPLYPPEPEACIDITMWTKEAQIPVVPHIMILPSDFHGFIKETDGSVVVNPGKLTKGLAGGTYALIEARPAQTGEEWALNSHVSSKIVRI